MRKKFMVLPVTLLLSAMLVFVGCAGGGETLGGGNPAMTAANSGLFGLVPANSTGVFTINFKKFAQSKFFDKMIEESKKKEDTEKEGAFRGYEDFVTKTGIDPRKDIEAMVIAISGKIGPGVEPEVVALVQLDYQKSAILKVMKENGAQFAEEDYKGLGLFKGTDSKGKDMSVSFINDKVIAVGKTEALKQVIDLSKGEGQSIESNAKLKPYLAKLHSGALASFVIDFPEESKKVQDGGMFKFDLSKAEAITGHIDYSSGTWDAELSMISHNPDGNSQLVTTLNGMKAMGAMAGPEVGEVINNIDLSASDDRITLKLTVTEELIEKLQKMAEEKKRNMNMM
ncbi:MAG: hypothetical protein GY940_14550 [bacterium]|nr:hypothetical protein [bacterium]